MTAIEPDRPGVIAPPPIIYAGSLALGFGLDALWPASLEAAGLPGSALYGLGAALIAIGLVLMAVAMRLFRRAGTNVPTGKPTTALVTAGIYRWSRNPIYLALSLIYAGIGVAADNPWILGLIVPLLAVIRYRVVAREEVYLERKFGESYRTYKASTRRWL